MGCQRLAGDRGAIRRAADLEGGLAFKANLRNPLRVCRRIRSPRWVTGGAIERVRLRQRAGAEDGRGQARQERDPDRLTLGRDGSVSHRWPSGVASAFSRRWTRQAYRLRVRWQSAPCSWVQAAL
ncbi:hypothetical protein CATMQ487_30450 [Sphaerotilus microaerophilus]|uniref:Uncharacterized protein n=1 Tax=Sphaerotilus microaerophilus TaxID=2914710 RepID=A0ABM7YNM0_9BURK|nr:hypothetical protein CATMQ487_30450 [Sphaerotilus sp. FB-5]